MAQAPATKDHDSSSAKTPMLTIQRRRATLSRLTWTFFQITSRASGAGVAAMGNGRAASRPPTAWALARGRENVTKAVPAGSNGAV